MIGQDVLISRICQYSIDTLPHSLLIEGPIGCGKHLLIDYIKDKFQLNLSNITDDVDNDVYVNMCLNANKTLYTIDCDKINNLYKILKILEEPMLNSFIALYTTDSSFMLDSIKSRCVLFKFDTYKKEDLLEFISSDVVDVDVALKIAYTPGTLKNLTKAKIEAIKSLSDNMIMNMNKSNLANALSNISNKFNYSGEDYDKIDVLSFLNYLEYDVATRLCGVEEDLTTLYKFVDAISMFKNQFNNKRLQQEYIMQQFIISLWSNIHESSRS